jgi:hypothetical protein
MLCTFFAWRGGSMFMCFAIFSISDGIMFMNYYVYLGLLFFGLYFVFIFLFSETEDSIKYKIDALIKRNRQAGIINDSNIHYKISCLTYRIGNDSIKYFETIIPALFITTIVWIFTK